MFDISRLRRLVKAPNSGLHEVKDGKVHVALQPGFLHNPDVGIKICLNSKLHQNLPDLNGILMGFEKVKKRGSGNLVSDTPFIHIDITGTFFILKLSVGEVLEVTVIKKGDGHLGALLHDVFNVSIIDNKLVKRDINLGDSVLVKVERVSNVGERPVLLANLVEPNPSNNVAAHVEETDSGVDSERGEKRKMGETEENVEDEEERRRQKKAAKKARKEKERVEASTMMAAPGSDDTDANVLDSVGNQKKTLNFQNSPEKKTRGPIQLSDLPEGFTIHIPEGKTYKLFKGPDGKTYRSLNDIKKRYLGEAVCSSPVRNAPTKEVVSSSPVKSAPIKATSTSSSPTKKRMGKEVKEHIEETLDTIVATWNIEEGTGDLAEDHPKFLAFSEKQLAEMDPFSKNFWVEPEKKTRVVKPKPTQLQAEEDMVDEIVAEELEEEHEDTSVKTDAVDNLEEPGTEKKKKKKKKRLSFREEDQATFMQSGEDQVDDSQMSEKKKKKKKKKKHSVSMDCDDV